MAKIEAIKDEEKRWRAESDLRTLVEAEAIRADAGRLKAAQTMARQKMIDMASVAADSKE